MHENNQGIKKSKGGKIQREKKPWGQICIKLQTENAH